MNKQEALKQIEEQRDMILGLHGWGVFGYIKGIINQLDEPQKIELPKVDFKKSQKVKIPQFVAKIIEYYKRHNATLYDVLREKNFNKQYNEWLMNEQDAYNKVARAWLDGYEVEEEKWYKIEVKGVIENSVLIYDKIEECWVFEDDDEDDDNEDTIYVYHTRKKLEDAGFGWVFDCEGVEVKELEDE